MSKNPLPPPKHKVMLITHDLAIGGLQRVVATLCQTINQDFFECCVVCLRDKGDFTQDILDCGIPVYLIEQKQNGVDYFSFLKVAALIRRFKPNTIHTHNTQPFMDGVMGALCAGILPTIIHTDHAREFPDKWRYMVIERILSWFTYKVVGVSDHTSKNLVAYEKIAPKKVVTIPNGICGDIYEKIFDNQALRASLSIPPECLLFGIGVRLCEQKAIGILLQAFKQVAESSAPCMLLIAGTGPLDAQLQQQAKSLGIDTKVKFLGPRLDIGALLSLFDIYVLPSLWEGLPMVLLEALAAGCPIIASRVGGISTAITNEENGLLVAPNDVHELAKAMKRLMSDSILRKQFAQQGKQTFKTHFSAQAMTRKYEKLYLHQSGTSKAVA